MAEIEFDDGVKRYPDGFEAVKHMSLQIRDAEFMILVGPSGCGKSTALRMIAGLEDISEGDLRIAGEVVNDLAPKDRDIAMVFQNYALYPHMTVRENMGFALKLRKAAEEEIRRRVEEAAKILDLEQHLDRKPANLSGGQRQRVAMGRAIVREPKAFLMDEPLSNLDAKLRVQMRSEVSRLQQRLGTTTVYVTHDQVEAMTLGDREVVVGIRPEDFEDAALAQTQHEGFVLEAPIELVESMGSEIYAHFGFEGIPVETDELRELEEDAGADDAPHLERGGRAVARLDPTSDVRAGRPARLWVDTTRMHLFDSKDGHSLTLPREDRAERPVELR